MSLSASAIMDHKIDRRRQDDGLDGPNRGPNRRLPLDGKGWVTLIVVAIVAIAVGAVLLIAR
jgi:hypothetical protein